MRLCWPYDEGVVPDIMPGMAQEESVGLASTKPQEQVAKAFGSVQILLQPEKLN